MTTPIPAVAAYDPYVGRAVDGVREAIAAGCAVLVRLHPIGAFVAASDPVSDQLDREGTAVLLRGYDDALGAFQYVDPVADEERELPYDEFGVAVVDSTLDFTIVISDLVLQEVADGDDTRISISMYRPHMPVVDLETVRLENVRVDVSSGTIAARYDGDGRFTVSIRSEDAPTACVRADLVGSRPLSFRRQIAKTVRATVAVR